MWLLYVVSFVLITVNVGVATKLAPIDQDCDDFGADIKTLRQRNMCLAYTIVAAQWLAAKTTCENNEGRLAVLDNTKKLEAATKLVQSVAAPSQAFVGAQKLFADFQWMDGENTPLPNESPLWNNVTGSEPDQLLNWAVSIDPTVGLLQDASTLLPLPFICEFETEMPMSNNEVLATDDLRLRCAELKGRQIGSSCFFVIGDVSVPTNNYEWQQCFEELAAFGARPARIYTQDIALKLSSLLVVNGVYWTGLRKWGETAYWMHDASTPHHAYDIRPKPKSQFAVGDNSLCVKIQAIVGDAGYPVNAAVQCTTKLQCIGEIVGHHQKFKKISYDQRLATINANGTLAFLTLSWSDERACAAECQQHDGCLGFNFNLGMASCELLAFKTDGIPAFGNWNAQMGTSFHERHH